MSENTPNLSKAQASEPIGKFAPVIARLMSVRDEVFSRIAPVKIKIDQRLAPGIERRAEKRELGRIKGIISETLEKRYDADWDSRSGYDHTGKYSVTPDTGIYLKDFHSDLCRIAQVGSVQEDLLSYENFMKHHSIQAIVHGIVDQGLSADDVRDRLAS